MQTTIVYHMGPLIHCIHRGMFELCLFPQPENGYHIVQEILH